MSAKSNASAKAQAAAKKLDDSLKDMLKNLTRMFADRALKQFLFGLLGPDGMNLPGFSTPLKFQHGGSFTVGGSGGTDSQLVAFRATPGERVDVHRAGSQGSLGAGTVLQPKIVVNNYADASIDSRTDNDGTLIMTVRAIARDELGSQSAQPVMAGSYGMRPRVRQR